MTNALSNTLSNTLSLVARAASKAATTFLDTLALAAAALFILATLLVLGGGAAKADTPGTAKVGGGVISLADVRFSSVDEDAKSISAMPDRQQFGSAERLVRGVLSKTITPAQFDAAATAISPVLLHASLYYIRAVEIRGGQTAIGQSALFLNYIQKSMAPDFIMGSIASPAVMALAGVRRFHKSFPAGAAGAAALAGKSLADVLIMQFADDV